VRIAELLTKCETFDNFMQVRYASVKRYGAEVCLLCAVAALILRAPSPSFLSLMSSFELLPVTVLMV
jgi:hypothetical protein